MAMRPLKDPQNADSTEIAECKRRMEIIRTRLIHGDYLSPAAAYQKKLHELKRWLIEAEAALSKK